MAYANINNLYTKPARNSSGLIAGQRLTVDNTAGGVSLTAITDANVITVEIQVLTNDVYCTFDGTTPSSSNGFLLYVGQVFTWSKDRANTAKFIRVTSNGAIQSNPSSI